MVKKPNYIVFIGRFQPPTNAHLNCAKDSDAYEDQKDHYLDCNYLMLKQRAEAILE